MQNTQHKKRSAVTRVVGTIVVLLLGVAIGRFADWPAETHAQQNQTNDPKAPKAFLSGSERSAIILKDVSATLKEIDKKAASIDKRVENIEKQLSRMEKK